MNRVGAQESTYIPAKTYEGRRPGYVFTTRSGRTGYFDDPLQVDEAPLAKRAKQEDSVDDIVARAEDADVEEVDAGAVRKLLLTLEKRITRNRQLRVKRVRRADGSRGRRSRGDAPRPRRGRLESSRRRLGTTSRPARRPPQVLGRAVEIRRVRSRPRRRDQAVRPLRGRARVVRRAREAGRRVVHRESRRARERRRLRVGRAARDVSRRGAFEMQVLFVRRRAWGVPVDVLGVRSPGPDDSAVRARRSPRGASDRSRRPLGRTSRHQ
mmetsp:Transcript_29571/g.91427  ORF Transcript_29571/g.91427 Transcript_29571/m.91427 type:complete len:268 (+) Transcript_29571:2187-2990(+)